MDILPRVLLVDDEPLVLRSVARALSRHFDVVPVSSGSAALAVAAADSELAAVICDLSMPGMDGIDVLHGLPPTLASRAILCHGGACSDRHRRFLSMYGGLVLEKPVGLDVLTAVVASVIGECAA